MHQKLRSLATALCLVFYAGASVPRFVHYLLTPLPIAAEQAPLITF
jgi:hypothetical protein